MSRMSAFVLLGLLLAGCSGGDEPAQVLPTLTAPATTPSAAAATQPATPESAVAFARHWYAEVTRAYLERDPAIVSVLSAPGCKACDRYIRSITEARDQDQRVEGVTFRLTLVEAQAIVGGRTTVAVIYDGPATRRTDASGKVVHSEPAVTGFEEELRLVQKGSSWLVTEDAAV